MFTSTCIASVPISAAQVSNLNLGTLTPGDSSATIPPGTSENAQNGSILVTGDPNVVYTIVLPASSVNLVTGGGTARETITLSNFLSFPPAGANGLLDSTGKQLLFIGATRAALNANQAPGAYTGSYAITVTY